MKNLLLATCMASFIVGCSASPSDQTSNSGLTSVSVTLPSKDKLPEALKGEGLSYCFSILEQEMSLDSSKINCEVPYAEGGDNVIQRGAYEPSLSLQGKLNSSKTYEMYLTVGFNREYIPSGQAAPSKVDSTATSSNSDALEIDTDRAYYWATDFITPRDMAGKSSLKVVMKLVGENLGGSENQGKLPSTISTEGDEGKDVDVSVDAVFVEGSNEQTAP